MDFDDILKKYTFRFDWTCREVPLEKFRTSVKEFHSLSAGNCDAVFTWWDLTMDPLGKVVLSCAPVWAHPSIKGNTFFLTLLFLVLLNCECILFIFLKSPFILFIQNLNKALN